MSATRAPLADAETRPVRLLGGDRCRECGARLDSTDATLMVPARRVATEVLADALVAQLGVEALATTGVVCQAGGHGPLRHVHAVPDPAAPYWAGHLGVPLDLGPDGVHLVPIQTSSIPRSFGEAAVEGAPNARWSR